MGMRWVVLMLGVGLAGLPSIVQAENRGPYQLASLPAASHVATIPQSAPTVVDQLARAYPTPQAVADLLRTHFTFKRDEELFGEADHWQSPEEFAARRVGDCEDYALLAQALLRRSGIEAHVLSLFGEDGYAHTVSVFVDAQGRYHVINQGALRSYRATSLEALASAIYPGWTFGGIAEQDGVRGRFVTQITNPDPMPATPFDDPGQAF